MTDTKNRENLKRTTLSKGLPKIKEKRTREENDLDWLRRNWKEAVYEEAARDSGNSKTGTKSAKNRRYGRHVDSKYIAN